MGGGRAAHPRLSGRRPAVDGNAPWVMNEKSPARRREAEDGRRRRGGETETGDGRQRDDGVVEERLHGVPRLLPLHGWLFVEIIAPVLVFSHSVVSNRTYIL